jgi:Fe-S-cluster-containing hydrogenase component 2
MNFGAFTSRDDFIRHVRNMALLGSVLFVWGITTGYVTNWVIVMIAIGAHSLQFADYFLGRTKGAAYFWLYLALQGFSNFSPFQFPEDQEAWKIQANKMIAWQYGGEGTPLFPMAGLIISLPVVLYTTYIAIRLFRTSPDLKAKAKKTVATKRWRIWTQSIVIGVYFWTFANGMTHRPVENPELIFWALAMLLSSLLLPFFIGRWFCGWMCPIGAFQDGIWKFVTRKPIIHVSDKFLAQMDRIYVPATMVLLILIYYTIERVFQLASSGEMIRSPNWKENLSALLCVKIVTNGMLIGSVLFAHRVFCRFFCWYIGYRVVLGQPSTWRIPFKTDRCRVCPTCEPEKNCVMGFKFQSKPEGEEDLSIRSIGEVPANCNLCFECRDLCPHGAFKKKIKRINVIPERCIGCRLCELACSGGRLGVFDPARSNIYIEMDGTPELPVPKILNTCDSCNGDPKCIKMCPAQVIIWDKEGVRKGLEPRRPGLVLQLLTRLNPFRKTPLPCPTPCAAYPAGCATCEINTARQAAQVKGEAA